MDGLMRLAADDHESGCPAHEAQELLASGIFNVPVIDKVWHEGLDCSDLEAAGGDDGPCGVTGACCFADCNDFPNTHGCASVIPGVCARGWMQSVIEDPNIACPRGDPPRVVRFFITDADGFGGCRIKEGINRLCSDLMPSRAFARTAYQGDELVCRCTLSVDPFLTPDLLAAGFTGCVRQVQDERTWEQACIMPTDAFDCVALGFPITIDEDGFAAFDAGNRRVNPANEVCTHALGDMYVDTAGRAHSLACPGVDDKVAIGDMAQPDCAAMYHDYRWDTTFVCPA